MRLTQIKLSGFKSFVDPTQFSLPGRLVGVVGPNGCGKSNIIDAARWVLGESKASELRGESMQDVIFNGSGQRKPAGRASVELVFDNTPDAAGKTVAGPWGQYSEIAVKRVLTRDGTSTYLINNQAVRRRDIQDIFLGTGLGPRAYAIIGQGMISRIIEARPDELRVFLEEAAGISKYKERRRETENRLADTRENLTRVEDILRELTANLERLEKQAVVAQQYRDLETEVDGKQKLLWLLRAKEAETLANRHRQEGHDAQLALDARVADLRRVEAELERTRSTHQAASDGVHAAQGRYYEAASAVSAIESEIRVVVESRNRLQAQLAQLAAQRDHWIAEGARLTSARDAAQASLGDATERIRACDAALADEGDVLPAAEGAARDCAATVDRLRTEVVGIQKDLELESTHQRNADRHLESIGQRKARLADERRQLAVPDTDQLASLQREGRYDDGDARREARRTRSVRGGIAWIARAANRGASGTRSREPRGRPHRCPSRRAEGSAGTGSDRRQAAAVARSSRARAVCRACGSDCASRRDSRPPSRRSCASASARSKSASSRARPRSSTMRRRRSSRSMPNGPRQTPKCRRRHSLRHSLRQRTGRSGRCSA